MSQAERVIAVPALGGAAVVVRCTRVTTRMLIEESVIGDVARQGLVYWKLTPTQFGSYTVGPATDVPPSYEPIVFTGHPGDHAPNKEPIGNGGSAPFPVGPGGPVTLGTVICQITSATATPVNIVVREWD